MKADQSEKRPQIKAMVNMVNNRWHIVRDDRIQSHEIQMGEFIRFISSKFQAFSVDPLFDPPPSACCCRTEGAADIFMELPATAAVGCGRQSPAPWPEDEQRKALS
jgi:hypothetical protein